MNMARKELCSTKPAHSSVGTRWHKIGNHAQGVPENACPDQGSSGAMRASQATDIVGVCAADQENRALREVATSHNGQR